MGKRLRWAILIGVTALASLGLVHGAMAANGSGAVGGGPASYPSRTQPAAPGVCEPPSPSDLMTALTTGRTTTPCRVGR